MNVASWLAAVARDHPDRVALLSGSNVIADYAAFHASAGGFAAWLAGRGIGPGARVVLLMRNCPEYLIAMFGVWIAGAAVVPVNAKLHPREVAIIVADSDPTLACVTPGMETGASALDTLDVTSDVFGSICDGPAMAVADLPSDALAWLFYTSGTTGRPKGVPITHRMLASMTECYTTDVDAVTSEDVHLYAAPMSHGAGLYALPYTRAGARHLCPASGGFDVEEVRRLAQAHDRLCTFMAPTMVQRLTRAAKAAGDRMAGLCTIVYGGGPMYRANIEEALDWFGPKFVQIYGQGECPMGITALSRVEIADRNHPDRDARIGSVGRAQSAVDVAIHDATGAAMACGEVGEIVVRGPTVMAGYWNAPEATARTIRDGWLATGDRGSMDADGYVTLKDRSKDVIISGGSNIYPREVEEAILTHPAVAEVSVVGRASTEWGEDVVAFVVLLDDKFPSGREIADHCAMRIARFKRPKEVVFVGELPKNSYGKVLKTDLRKRLQPSR